MIGQHMQAETQAQIDIITTAIDLLRKHVDFEAATARLAELEALGLGALLTPEQLLRRVEALFKAANADPRMEQVYDRYHAAWAKVGGGMMCHFSSVSAWSKYGSWGLLQYADDDPSASPKLRAVRSWARAQGQKLSKQRAR